MPKPKAPPKDYDADIRFAPAPENATKEGLWKRADEFVTQTLLRNRGQRRAPTGVSKTK